MSSEPSVGWRGFWGKYVDGGRDFVGFDPFPQGLLLYDSHARGQDKQGTGGQGGNHLAVDALQRCG